jgi:uncharacterized membrane protein
LGGKILIQKIKDIMEKKDIDDIVETLDLIQGLKTIEEKYEILKYIKREIRKLEIMVVIFGLIGLSLIILPLFGVMSYSFFSILAIVFCGFFIRKAFMDGESHETAKFFLLMSIGNLKNNEKYERKR